MDKTRVDDMLIEMITPKVKEIEEKFGKGEGLEQEDINMLLLKSQYNHINHLDMKLDEVTQDVASLKVEFNELNNKFDTKFKVLEADIKTTIQESLNKNMMQLIAVIGAFVILSKIIDKF